MQDWIPVREGLFTSADDGSPRLVAGRCPACEATRFPLSSTCQMCGVAEMEQVLVGGDGATLWGWTAVNAAPPGYRGEVPYGFGVVELPEGLRLITRLTESDPSRLRFGQPMHLVIDRLHTDDEGTEVLSWTFSADEEA